MPEKADIQFERLRRVIQAGMLRFVFLWGICGWGLSTGGVFFVVTYLLGWQIGDPVRDFLLPILGIFMVGGTGFGTLLWLLLRWQYSRQPKVRAVDPVPGA